MLDLLPDPEQQQIVDSAGAFLADRFPIARYRRQPVAGIALETWRDMAALGWFGIGVPESMGGVGLSVVENVLLLRECGRRLGPMAVLASMLAARLAAGVEDEALAGAIVSGESRVALALPMHPSARADTLQGEWLAIDAPDAALLLGWSDEHAFLVPLAACVRVEPCHSLDPTSSTAHVDVTHAAPRARWNSRTIAHLATLFSAAMLVGLAESARDMAVAYAKEREQFGQPIGAFQAIKHMCADMAVRCEAASAQMLYAAMASRDAAHDAALEIAAAKLLGSTAALRNAAVNIQIHGGMGFTAECDAHLLLKRAHLVDQLGGAQRRHQDLLGRTPAHRRGAASAT